VALSGPVGSGIDSINWPLWFATEQDAVSGNSEEFSQLFNNHLSRIAIALASAVTQEEPSLSGSILIHPSLLDSKAPLQALLSSDTQFGIESVYHRFLSLCEMWGRCIWQSNYTP